MNLHIFHCSHFAVFDFRVLTQIPRGYYTSYIIHGCSSRGNAVLLPGQVPCGSDQTERGQGEGQVGGKGFYFSQLAQVC